MRRSGKCNANGMHATPKSIADYPSRGFLRWVGMENPCSL